MIKPTPTRIAIAIDMEWPLKRHHDAVAGILRYARQATDWVCSLEPFVTPAQRVHQKFDGLVGRINEQMAASARRSRMPAVNIWASSPDQWLPRVIPDLPACGRLAAEHLISRGFRRFAHLGDGSGASDQQRAGYTAALAGHGQQPVQLNIPVAIRDAPAWRSMQDQLNQWVSNWSLPIGVLACEDLAGRYLIDVCVSRGLRVPDDVAVIGCGNEDLVCDSLEPSLTSIEEGYQRIGYRAASVLHELMQGQTRPTEPVLVDPVELVPRRSTDVFAVDDRIVADALRFIWDHSDKPISVDDVVEPLPMTRRTLERRFGDIVKRSIHNEIMRSRIERAKHLLVDTDRPIQLIASACGFCSQAHLATVFRRLESTSPSAYRKRQTSV